MSAPVIDLKAYRKTGQIVERVPVQYDDVRIEFARRVEERLREIEAVSAGLPADCEERA